MGRMLFSRTSILRCEQGEVFVILGGSGSGKSTLLKNLIGLYTPLEGEVWIEGGNLIAAKGDERRHLLRKFGVTYQSGALVRLDDRIGKCAPAAG